MTKLIAITLDTQSLGRASSNVEHERDVAIYDLIEDNTFAPLGFDQQGFKLTLSLIDNRLIFDIRDDNEAPLIIHGLSLTPFKRIIKDYFLVCDSYYSAIRASTPSQIEAIDMGRRGLHNEGSTLLMERLNEKVSLDFETARRLFTLISALAWRG